MEEGERQGQTEQREEDCGRWKGWGRGGHRGPEGRAMQM